MIKGVQRSLLITEERENAGSDTIKRYEFQKNFSIQLLMELYNEKEDFVIMLEFQDDLLVLDSSINPKKIDFYQVKSKNDGDWTLSKLLYHKKEKNSFLGKMYLNKINFPNHTDKLIFVSNARYNLKLINDGEGLLKRNIKCSHLSKKEKKVLHEKINMEFSKDIGNDFEKISNFYMTPYDVDGSVTHCIGLLSSLIEEISPGIKLNIQVAYNSIYDHINRKSGNIFEGIDKNNITEEDFNNLIKLKGLTKEGFSTILKALGIWKNPDIVWEKIEHDLRNCNVPPLLIKKYKSGWNSYRSTLIASRDNAILFEDIVSHIKTMLESEELEQLNIIELKDTIYEQIFSVNKFSNFLELYKKSLIDGLIFNTIYDE